jgi:hypothetical protein
VNRLKRLLLAATLITNIWSALAPADGNISAGTVFLYVVIPLVVYLIAEVMPVITTHCVAIRETALAAIPSTNTPRPAAHPRPVNTPAADIPTTAVLSSSPRPGIRTGLPPALEQRLEDKQTELGRPLVADEIRTVLKVSPDYAARLATQLA